MFRLVLKEIKLLAHYFPIMDNTLLSVTSNCFFINANTYKPNTKDIVCEWSLLSCKNNDILLLIKKQLMMILNIWSNYNIINIIDWFITKIDLVVWIQMMVPWSSKKEYNNVICLLPQGNNKLSLRLDFKFITIDLENCLLIFWQRSFHY